MDLAISDDATAFAKDGGGDVDLLADDGVVLVVGVIGVTEFAVRSELELQEFMPELPLVPYVVPQVELALRLFSCPGHLSLSLRSLFVSL